MKMYRMWLGNSVDDVPILDGSYFGILSSSLVEVFVHIYTENHLRWSTEKDSHSIYCNILLGNEGQISKIDWNVGEITWSIEQVSSNHITEIIDKFDDIGCRIEPTISRNYIDCFYLCRNTVKFDEQLKSLSSCETKLTEILNGSLMQWTIRGDCSKAELVHEISKVGAVHWRCDFDIIDKSACVFNCLVENCKGNIIVKAIEMAIYESISIRHIAKEAFFFGDKHSVPSWIYVNIIVSAGRVLRAVISNIS